MDVSYKPHVNQAVNTHETHVFAVFKKRTVANLLMVALAIVMIVLPFAGCDNGAPDTSDLEGIVVRDLSSNDFSKTVAKEPSGAGFDMWFGGTPRTAGAVKSEYSIFDVKAVVLDFYFGCRGTLLLLKTYPMFGSAPDDYETVCVTLYFIDGNGLPLQGSNNLYDDYKKIDGFYHVRDISVEEFTSGEYVYTYIPEDVPFMPNTLTDSISGVIELNHHETLIVPAGVFIKDSNRFTFQIAAVQYSNSTNSYRLQNQGYISVVYEFLDEQTVQLSEPRPIGLDNLGPIIYR